MCRPGLALAFASSLLVTSAGFADGPPPRPHFVRITHEEGLSDDTVDAIVEDHRGFLWFGTRDGLNRYDAHTFVTYRHDPGDRSSLSHNSVHDLLVDRRGTLWVATMGGVDVYDPARDAFEPVPRTAAKADGADAAVVLYEDPQGGLWAGTFRGLDRIDAGRRIRVPVFPDLRTSPGATAIVMDRGGDLWIGTFGRGVVRWNPRQGGGVREYAAGGPEGLVDGHVFALLEDRHGDLWVGTRGGLHRKRRGEDVFTPLLADPDKPGTISNDHIDCLFEDHQGRLWVGTDGGGLNAAFDDGTFTAFFYDAYDETTPGSNSMREIYEDRRGDLWIGTFTGGIGFFNRASAAFTHVGHRPDDDASLSHDGVLSFLEDRDGGLWIGTEGGLNRLEPPTEDSAAESFRVYRHDPRDPRSLDADAVVTLLEDRRRRIWAGTYYGGLHRFDRATEIFTRYPAADEPGSLRNPHVWDLAEDHEGRLWVATHGGLHRFEEATGTFAFYGLSNGGAASVGEGEDVTAGLSHVIWKLCVDAGGALWLGTQDGLRLYDRERDRFKTYRPDGPTMHRQVLTIVEDRERRLWLGTGSGLLLFDRDSETFSAPGAEITASAVASMVEDDGGHLWLATNSGLVRYDPSRNRVTHYDKSDGLIAFPFIRDASLRGSDGQLYFGGINGYDRFHPDQLRPDTEVPPIVLTGFEIFNQPATIDPKNGPLRRHVSMAERVRLRRGESVFTLRWSALSYRGSARNRYSYKLESFDAGWSEAGPRRSATYTNLDPGEYVFRVRGANASGVWNEAGASIRIRVLAPLWRTGWFQAAAGSLLVALLVGWYRLLKAKNYALAQQNAELEAKNAELERFTYTVSHDLKAPLVTIKGFLGLLRSDARSGDLERLDGDIAHISHAADKMYALLTQLLELSRIGHQVHADGEVALSEVARSAARLVEETGDRDSVIDIDRDMPVVRGDPVRMEEVFQNLIGNALKFMGDQKEPRVEVGARSEGREVVCWVRDNGKGIDERYLEKVFGLFERLDADEEGTGVGLALVKRIVELHGGRIWAESEGSGRGSTFWFTLARHS